MLLRGRGRELEEYERFRAEYRIAKSLVIGYDEGEYAGNSDYIEGLAGGSAVAGAVAVCGSRRGSRLRSITGDARSPGVTSVTGGAISVYATDAAAGIFAADALAAQAAAPAILSLNATPESLAVLEPVLRTLDRTWVLISHLGLPGPVDSPAAARARLGPLLRLAGLPHVSVKLSGQYAASTAGHPTTTPASWSTCVAEAFGAGALVWGSDFSPCLDFVSLEEAVDCLLPAGASAGEQHDILFGNADRSFHQYAGALR